jgi:leucyl aminopeptidase (aminopeptidase T)
MASVGLVEEGETLKVTFQDGWAVKIEGGEKAERLKELLAPFKNSKHLAEIMFGTNPKSRINLKQEPLPLEAERHAGNTHIAMGRALGAKYPAKTHFDGFVLKPTIYLDDKIFVDKGRLTVLDYPEIREIAKKYGDPDEVLAEKWEVIK